MTVNVVLIVRKFSAALTATAALLAPAPARAQTPSERPFAIAREGEVVATITAGCARCDWGVEGREATVLTLAVDGGYSQHLVLTRGEAPAEYRVMLGALRAGTHTLSIDRDAQRSAPGTGTVTIARVAFETFGHDAPEYEWLARAPLLRARPGSLEKFSDAPLLMYAETNVAGESGSGYRLQYTVIFTNEDGGTPTDRLMATWGRTTDIEFIYGLTDPTDGSAPREEIQAAGHRWVTFNGPRVGTHPMLWVATDNNMVADHGPEEVVRFAPAPQLVSLKGTSREAVMDANPWMYAVTSAEMVREHRLDPNATPGSGRIVDPRRYVTLEACGRVRDATLAFDIGIRGAGGAISWLPTDTDPRFRIARGGCFRGGAPAPEGVSTADIAGLRIRAYARAAPAAATSSAPPASVVLERVTKVFMLDRNFVPSVAPIRWNGALTVPVGGTPIAIPIAGR